MNTQVEINLRKIIDTIQNSFFAFAPAADKILNLGAADGNFIKKYPYVNYDITNLDNESEGDDFKKCKKEYPNVKNITGECSDLSMFDDSSFDLVVFTHLIEHLSDEDIDKTIKEIKRVLKKDGFILLSTPNGKIREFFGMYKANEYHKTEYTYEELKEIIDKHELKVIKKYGALYVEDISNNIIPSIINRPENSYVIWLILKNNNIIKDVLKNDI